MLSTTDNALCVTPSDDAFEPNDTREAVTSRRPGEYSDHFVVGGNEDGCRIETCTDGSLSLTATFVHDQGDIDIEQSDDMGRTLANGNGSNDDEVLQNPGVLCAISQGTPGFWRQDVTRPAAFLRIVEPAA